MPSATIASHPVPGSQFIDGAWQPGAGEPFDALDPTHGQPLAALTRCGILRYTQIKTAYHHLGTGELGA